MIQSIKRSVIALLTAVSLSSCALLLTQIDEHTPPPPGWPELVRKSHYVDGAVIRQHCPDTAFVLACAVIDLYAGTCDKYFPEGPPVPYFEWHEEMHCKGYDHPGGTEIKRLMDEYNASNYLIVKPDVGWYLGKPGE